LRIWAKQTKQGEQAMLESNLLRQSAGYVANRWTFAKSGGTIPVHDPATGEHLADVPNMGEAETIEAVEAAEKALARPASIEQRRHWLSEIHRLLMENKKEMARIITREQGKPLKESEVEVEYSAGFFRYFATQLHHLEPEVLPEPIRNLRWTVHKRPAGVVGLITPWNFPLAMLGKKLAPALGAGCGIVVKPPAPTPLTSVALWHLLEKLDLPTGLVNLVIGRPRPISKVLCSHPAVRLISFTGSTEVGKELMAQVAPYVKRLALELGGNAPFIVMDDADVDLAADALMMNKFRCAGQTCVCANRVYVQRGIEKAFLAAISERVSRLRVGNGSDPQTDVGPLINRAAFEKVDEHVQDALKLGAKTIVGGDPKPVNDDWGAFYPPTVLANANAEMMVSRDETFGPILAIQTFDSESEVVAKANSTQYGLAAYLFTGNRQRADDIIRQLHFGHVGLNTGTGPAPEAPFGGMKESGFGREGGVEGLIEFTECQAVAGT
jgi:succinate-semialdehyde dehydrogenase/glutarate-semialdehyde dehydrogenase